MGRETGRRAARALAQSAVIALVGWCSAASGQTIDAFTEPIRTIELAASELGVVDRVLVQEGQHVREGQIVAELDAAVLMASLAMARARANSDGALLAAQAELDLRRERLSSLRQLDSSGNATPGELARAEADVAIAAARVKIAEQELAMHRLDCARIETQIARRKIRSPVSAVVSKVHRDVGEALLAHDPVVVTLVQLDQLRVRFYTPPEQAARLQQGQRVPLSLPDLRQTVSGTVDWISPVMEGASSTIEVAVTIDNSEGKIRSGARCMLELGAALAQPSSPRTTRPVGRTAQP